MRFFPVTSFANKTLSNQQGSTVVHPAGTRKKMHQHLVNLAEIRRKTGYSLMISRFRVTLFVWVD